MKTFAEALRGSGVSPTELQYVLGYPGGLLSLWTECADPILMMRIASAAGADPKSSVAIAIDGATAVAAYVGPSEPRPARAVEIARSWLHGRATAKECESAAFRAEAVGAAYRNASVRTKTEKRAYRAASFAAYAAAKAALVARDAAVTTELDYDDDYTFEDAWNGARGACAIGAAQALIDAVEAAVAAVSANVTLETETAVAGAAAGEEARTPAMGWAASVVRAHLTVENLRLGQIR